MAKTIPKLKKGTLGGKGFFNKSDSTRRRILTKLVKKKGERSVMSKLGAISILNKRRNPELSSKAQRDRHWVAENFVGKKKI